MDRSWLDALSRRLVGRRCTIKRREFDWPVNPEGGGAISLEATWRIVGGGRIEFVPGDDGHLSGLSTPVDGETRANRLLTGRAMTAAFIDKETSSPTPNFGDVVRLAFLNSSSGYETWQISLNDKEKLDVTALCSENFLFRN